MKGEKDKMRKTSKVNNTKITKCPSCDCLKTQIEQLKTLLCEHSFSTLEYPGYRCTICNGES